MAVAGYLGAVFVVDAKVNVLALLVAQANRDGALAAFEAEAELARFTLLKRASLEDLRAGIAPSPRNGPRLAPEVLHDFCGSLGRSRADTARKADGRCHTGKCTQDPGMLQIFSPQRAKAVLAQTTALPLKRKRARHADFA